VVVIIQGVEELVVVSSAGRRVREASVGARTGIPGDEMLRPWSQQAWQLKPQRGTVAHLGNRRLFCVHIHTEGIGGCLVFTFTRGIDRPPVVAPRMLTGDQKSEKQVVTRPRENTK